MKKRLLILLGLFLTTVPAAFAQRDEFGAWLEVEGEKAVTKRLDLSVGIGLRANDNVREMSRWNISLGGSYEIFKWLKAGLTYQCISDLNRKEVKEDYKKSNGAFNGYNVDEKYRRDKHRVSFDLTGKTKIGRFTISLRERYQYTHSVATDVERERYRDEAPAGYENPDNPGHQFGGQTWLSYELANDRKHSKNNHLMRTRVEVEYDIPKCKFTPSVSYELKNSLQDAFKTTETRLIAGVKWKVNKKNTLSLDYLFNDGHYSDEPNLHVVSVGYKFKF